MDEEQVIRLAKSIEIAGKRYVKEICCGRPIVFRDLKKGRYYKCKECGSCFYDHKCGWCCDTGVVPYAVLIEKVVQEKVAICKCNTANDMDINAGDTTPKMPYYFDHTDTNRMPVCDYPNLFKFEGQHGEYNYQMDFQKAMMKVWEDKKPVTYK